MRTKSSLDVATIAASLARLGVPYLQTREAAEPLSLSPHSLLAALAQHSDPRVREALIPLFLRHPEYASFVPALVAQLPPEGATVLRHFYTAAVYLQRLWRTTLGIYLGEFPLLPDTFGQAEFNLPAPDVHFGEAGLRELAKRFEAETGYDWLSVYESAISLFLAQLRLEAANDH